MRRVSKSTETLQSVLAELIRLHQIVPEERVALSEWIDKAIIEAKAQIERARSKSIH